MVLKAICHDMEDRVSIRKEPVLYTIGKDIIENMNYINILEEFIKVKNKLAIFVQNNLHKKIV